MYDPVWTCLLWFVMKKIIYDNCCNCISLIIEPIRWWWALITYTRPPLQCASTIRSSWYISIECMLRDRTMSRFSPFACSEFLLYLRSIEHRRLFADLTLFMTKNIATETCHTCPGRPAPVRVFSLSIILKAIFASMQFNSWTQLRGQEGEVGETSLMIVEHDLGPWFVQNGCVKYIRHDERFRDWFFFNFWERLGLRESALFPVLFSGVALGLGFAFTPSVFKRFN